MMIADLNIFFENSLDEDFSVSIWLNVAQARQMYLTLTQGKSTWAMESLYLSLAAKWDVMWKR
jgi:hypothetical protein